MDAPKSENGFEVAELIVFACSRELSGGPLVDAVIGKLDPSVYSVARIADVVPERVSMMNCYGRGMREGREEVRLDARSLC